MVIRRGRGMRISFSVGVALLLGLLHSCDAANASLGLLLPLDVESPGVSHKAIRYAASATMAIHHISQNTLLGSSAELPTGFQLSVDIKNSFSVPSAAVDQVLLWREEGRHAVIGPLQSEAVAPAALVASIDSTPLLVWCASASALSDRTMFPTLTRTVVRDAVKARLLHQSLSGMGWRRIAILTANTAHHRAFTQELESIASKSGIDIATSAVFGENHKQQQDAVHQVQESGARLVVAVVEESNVAALASLAHNLSMLTNGYAWVVASHIATSRVITSSPEPETTRQQLSGWLTADVDLFHGERGQRFRTALEGEPLEHLNHTVFQGSLSAEALTGCDQCCGAVYDAVWSAAIAISGMTADAAADKKAVLKAIRNVSFDGATGRVEYDSATGERDVDAPLVYRNLQENPGDALSMASVVTWRFQSERLVREGSQPPVWPGGQRGWDLPRSHVVCGSGLVFSAESMRCEGCPGGHRAEGEECVRFHASIGVLIPLRWSGAGGPMEAWAVRHAAASAMAAAHINRRDSSLVPGATALLPANFTVVVDVQDSQAAPSVAVRHAVAWGEQGVRAVIGSYRSAVTGPLALAASIAATPVIAWGATASTLADRDTYPTLSRSIVHDGVVAAATMRTVRALGWTRIGVMHVDDAWGRAFLRDALIEAEQAGVHVASAPAFKLGDKTDIAEAVRQLADDGVFVTVCVAFQSDIALVAAAAAELGMLEEGHAWVAAIDVNDFETWSDDTRRQMTGWLTAAIDALAGDKGERFQAALQAEPLHDLDSDVLEGSLTRELVASEPCHHTCGVIYDAIWTAAIAMSSLSPPGDATSSPDPAALLSAIRNVSFEGATGRVQYDEIGEREAADMAIVVKNFRPRADGGGIAFSPAWKWRAGVLERDGEEPPVWPGGQAAWSLPRAVLECPDGAVFSVASLQCEACPAGTAKARNECVRFDASVGVLVPLWSLNGTLLSDAYVRVAAAAMMAVHHINARVDTLVPHARQLLPEGFRMVAELRDTHGLSSTATRHALDFSQAGRHAIVGSLRSSVSEPVARVAALDDVPVVSWGSEIPRLSDKSEYPTFSRTIPSLRDQIQGMVSVLDALSMRRVAFLFGDALFGSASVEEATRFGAEVGMQIAASSKYLEDDADEIDRAVQEVRASGARVILWFPTTFDVWNVVEAACRSGLFGPGYVWVIADFSWLVDAIYASAAEAGVGPPGVAECAVGWLMVQLDFPDQERLDAVQDAMSAETKEDLTHPLVESELSRVLPGGGSCKHCAFIYDAVWATAIAVHKTRSEAATQDVDSKRLLANIRHGSFEGASGRVRLDPATGDRLVTGTAAIAWNLQPVPGYARLQPVRVWRLENGTLHRESSSAPWWPGGNRSWQPPQDGSCDGGFVFDPTRSRCVACPPGSVSATDVATTECVPCGIGTFAAEAGSKQCSRCQTGYANATGMTTCWTCPAHTSRRPASPGADVSECLCDVGFYRPRASAWECAACPVGASCPGGLKPPHPIQGYWGDRGCDRYPGGNTTCEQWDLFLMCDPEQACVGGRDFACARGRSGRLCATTAEGWFVVGQENWFECGPAGAVVTVVLVGLVVLCWVGIELLVSHSYPVFQVLLTNIQVFAMIAAFDLRWTSTLRPLQMFLSIADFDIDFIQPSCVIGSWSETSAFYLQLLLPLLFACGSGLVHIAKDAAHGRRIEPGELLLAVRHQFVLMTLTIHHTLTTKCFQSFSCTSFPDGRAYLSQMVSVECGSAAHASLVSLSALYIVVVLFLTPAYTFWALYQHVRGKTLHTPPAVRQWGWLHVSYEADWKLWEAVMLARRFVVALLSVVQTPMLQGALTIVTLTGLLAAHVWARPFINARVDVLDFCSICGAILFTLGGMLLYPSITEKAQRRVCEEGAWGDEHCGAEASLKAVVAATSFGLVAVTIAVSMALAYYVFVELKTARKASKLVYRGFKQREEEEESVQDVRGFDHVVPLEAALKGSRLMRWVVQVSGQQATMQRRTLTQSYSRVDRSLRDLDEDVTQFAHSTRAAVLRRLCEMDGLLEVLCWRGGEVQGGVSDLVEALVAHAEGGRGVAHANPLSDSVNFEHRTVVTAWLLACSPADRDSFVHLMDSILRANGIHPHPPSRTASELRSGPKEGLLGRDRSSVGALASYTMSSLGRGRGGQTTRDALVPPNETQGRGNPCAAEAVIRPETDEQPEGRGWDVLVMGGEEKEIGSRERERLVVGRDGFVSGRETLFAGSEGVLGSGSEVLVRADSGSLEAEIEAAWRALHSQNGTQGVNATSMDAVQQAVSSRSHGGSVHLATRSDTNTRVLRPIMIADV